MAGGVKAIIASQFEDSGLKKAQKGFQGLGKTIKGALGAVGVGLGVSALVGQLNAAGKAATQDAKSQGLLANALKNTANATDLQIAAVETSISKMESLSAVADDNIRPVFAQLARVTGDVGKATELTNLALDVAAGTGRDLSAVSIALGKAYQGNTASLAKLGINVKGVSDPMAMLAKQFDGAAEAAANLDPYQRLQIIFGNLQEDIGVALLPYLNQLADYFNSPQGQKALEEFAYNVAEISTSMFDLAASIAETGVIDLLTEFFTIAAKVAKLDFSGIGQQLNNNVMEGWVDKYINNRAQFDKDMEVLKENEKDYYKRIMAFVNNYIANIKNNQGQFGSIRAIEEAYKKSEMASSLTGGLSGTRGTGTGVNAAQKAAAAAAKAAQAAIKAATDAADEMAKAYIEAAEAAAELVSESGKLTSALVSVFKTAPQMGAFETAAIDAFSNIFDLIESALGDGKILSGAASSLLEYATIEARALQSIGRQRDILAGKLDVARTITSGVTGLLNVTQLLETTSRSVTETVTSIVNGISLATTRTFDVVSSGGLVDNFQKLVDKTKAFAKNLLDLKKLGLNKQLFAQLVNAGADAGGATAEALVAGGAETISALNSLYNELALSAGDIASTATDTLYEVGQQIVSNGFIEGLLSQDSELQRAAQTLAEAFASTFQTQLQVAVDAVLPTDSTMIDQVAAVNLAGGGVGGRGIAYNMASAGRGTIFNAYISAGVVTDPNSLARTVIDSVKKYERSNGSVWVAA
jgi:hypothetical protein